MCSGRVDLGFVLRAFYKGIDGVFIGACRLNECNYITQGNYHALRVTHICKKLLEYMGINPDRVRIEFMSSGEGTRFARVVADFTKKIRELGPLGEGDGLDKDTMSVKLKAALSIVPYIRLAETERLRLPKMPEDQYEEFFASEEGQRLFEELIGERLSIAQIMILLKERAMSTAGIAEKLGLSPSQVSKYLSNSSKMGLVRYDMDQKRFAHA